MESSHQSKSWWKKITGTHQLQLFSRVILVAISVSLLYAITTNYQLPDGYAGIVPIIAFYGIIILVVFIQVVAVVNTFAKKEHPHRKLFQKELVLTIVWLGGLYAVGSLMVLVPEQIEKNAFNRQTDYYLNEFDVTGVVDEAYERECTAMQQHAIAPAPKKIQYGHFKSRNAFEEKRKLLTEKTVECVSNIAIDQQNLCVCESALYNQYVSEENNRRSKNACLYAVELSGQDTSSWACNNN